MNLDLEASVVLVMGSSRGIGREIARSFLAERARVVLTARGSEALEETRKALAHEFGEDNLFHHAGDLIQPGVADAVVKLALGRWGRIDAVVANLGSGSFKPGLNFDDDQWNASFEINLRGAVRIVDAVLPHFDQQGSGSIVFIDSIAGVEATGAPLAYSSAKAALLNFSKNLARQTAAKGIRVNTVAPGNILFPGGSWSRHIENRPQEVESHIQTEVPMRRFGTPREVADLVVFLSSARASFVTGSCLVVDGGQTRSL